MSDLCSPLFEYLVQFKGQKVKYALNPGNAGDALITAAATQMLHRIGIDFEVVDSRDLGGSLGRRDIVLYSGGGGLVSVSPSQRVRRFVEHYHRAVHRLVILPHTISGNEDLLSELGSNVDLICRERYSYEHVRKYAVNANCKLMPDVAFCLDMSELWAGKRREGVTTAVVGAPRALVERLIDWSRTRRRRGRDGAVLNAFRLDKERTSIAIPDDNLDVSALLKRSIRDVRTARAVSRRLLSFLQNFDLIRTNRLHVAIAAALLGKTVHLYANSYYKNYAVYDYSLKPHFSNLQWIGSGMS